MFTNAYFMAERLSDRLITAKEAADEDRACSDVRQ